MKPNIRAIYDTYSSTIVDFSIFSKFLVKILKIHNFGKNGLIFTGIVLNNVFYRVLHFFFCMELDSSWI
jgi:hypothetical protein